MNGFENYRSHFRTTLLFLGLPLLIEAIVYLIRPEIFPSYLSKWNLVRTLGLTLIYFAAFFAMVCAIFTLSFRFFKVIPEAFLACFVFTFHLALATARLLPHDSGITFYRVLVLFITLLITGALYMLLRLQPVENKKLLVATCLFAAASSFLLARLFQFPVSNAFFAFVIYLLMFLLFVYTPGKILAGIVVFVFILSLQSRSTLPAFAPPKSIPPYEKVILVGIDGLSPDVLQTLVDEKKLPVFQNLMEGGSHGILQTLDTPYSPLIWNAIYTGTEPRDHGVMAFTHTGVPGGVPFFSLWLDNWSNSDWFHKSAEALKGIRIIRTQSPALSKHRLKPALWEMINQNHGNSVVLGGWTTFPPEKIDGLYVSDFALMKKEKLYGTFYPPDKEIESLLSEQADVKRWPPDLQRYVQKDQRVSRLIRELELTEKDKFVFAYFSAADAFGHHYGTYINKRETSKNRRAELLNLLSDVYKQMDEYLGQVLKHMDDKTLLIICSDHGFKMDKRQHNYPVDGAILLYGKGVRRNLSIRGDVYSIAPTVLYALQMPAFRDFKGQPLKQAFEGLIPAKGVKAYHLSGKFFEFDEKEFDKDKLEELRDLQYLR